MPSQNLSLLFSDFVHAKSIEPANGHLKLVMFPDGFSCYTHTSVWETEYIYNEVCVKQEYLRHGLTLEGAPCVFDVGANIGVFTLFVKANNPRAVVHAFEPIQDTYDVLRRNVELHRLTEVYTHNIALGSQTASQRTFTYYPNMAGSTTATPAIKKTQRRLMEEGAGKVLTDQFFESETRIASVRTLSSFLDEQAIPAIGFLKIDVEGDELAVLQGIAREHFSDIRQLVIEAHTPEIAHKVCALLTGIGFKVVSDIGTGQQDMMQVKWGSHGDYEIIALSPDSPQECFDLTIKAFNLSELYRVPVFVMTDECVGHMHEKVIIPPAEEIELVERKWYTGPKDKFLPYKNDKDGIPFMVKAGDGYRFHTTGLTHDERGYPVINAECQDVCVRHLVDKIRDNADKIIEIEEKDTDKADVVVISYGITSRVSVRAVQKARDAGIKVGTMRLISVWPFPEKRIYELAERVLAWVVPEINLGQMIREVERAVGKRSRSKVVPVSHAGGDVHDPNDIYKVIKEVSL